MSSILVKFLKRVLLFLLVLSGVGRSQDLIISEVMFYAPSGNNEFIELYNKSETAYINLSGYKIKYYTSNTDSVISAGYGTILPPKSYAVIFEGDYSFSTGIYNSIVPSNALKLKIDDNAFGTNGMANTTDRELQLLNISNVIIDRYVYSANNLTGISDEKKILNNDTTSFNWGNSLRYLGSPGYKNSISPSLQDISLTGIKLMPAAPYEYSPALLQVAIKNTGINISGAFILNIYSDSNLDSIPSPSELMQAFNFDQIAPGDSLVNDYNFITSSSGKYNLIAKVVYYDEDTLNNILMHTFNVMKGSGAVNKIAINEIMYAPSTGHPEWVELYNRSTEAINLKKWKLSDNSSTAAITTKSKLLMPGKFVVLCKDSSVLQYYHNEIDLIVMALPQLNNSGDRVVLKDSLFNIIDSLDYLPEWGGNVNGFSLERISADESPLNSYNWSTSESIFKGTPCKINSAAPKNSDLSIKNITLPKYAVVGEAAIIKVKIKNKGLTNSPDYKVKLYYDADADSTASAQELFLTLNGSSIASGDSIEMQGMFNVVTQGMNYFIAVLESFPDEDADNNICFNSMAAVSINTFRTDIVVNEIMFAPEPGHPEYIELFNKSSKTVNMKNFSAADSRDTIRVVSQDLFLQPEEYFVIASDSSFYNFYAVKSKVIIKNLPSLNNTGDKLFILDSLSRVIDSVKYGTEWIDKDGYSLERINVSGSSVDSANWSTSLSKYKATPGYINSVSIKQKDIKADKLVFLPENPIKGDSVSISVMIKNNGTSPALANITLFEDTDLDSTADIEWQSVNNIFIAQLDSLSIKFTQRIENINSPKGFYCSVDIPDDQDTSNNYCYSIIRPGVIPSTVVINEIMYSPAGGEPEWIELYNKSNESILLKNWCISDVVTTPLTEKIKDYVYIDPNSYLVLTSDSSIYNYHLSVPCKVIKMTLPSFNNTGDGVVLKDNRMIIIDSLLFSAEWGGQMGYSLERVSPDQPSILKISWKSSEDIEGSTPGRINSVKIKQNDASVTAINITPRFPIAGDIITVSGTLKNLGFKNIDNLSAFLYCSDSLISLKENISILSKDSLEIVFPEKVNSFQSEVTLKLKINCINDEDTINNVHIRKVLPGLKEKSIVINEIMYDPVVEGAEWIELYNPTPDTVNLKNWIISDIITPTEGKITLTDYFIYPDNYVVIAKDTSFKSHYPASNNVLIADFGILGNISDGVILYDFRKGIIDSVMYNNNWEHKKGYSIERYYSMGNSSDSSNWFISVAPEGSSPGKVNSILNVIPGIKESVVINEIMYDPGNDNCEFIELHNNTDKKVSLSGWFIEDKSCRRTRISDSFTLNPSEYFVAASDSSFIKRYNSQGKYLTILNKSDLGLTSDGIVILKDLMGNVIDSVHYTDKWHNKSQPVKKDHSLERINPALRSNDPLNWSTSINANGATPGGKNSIYLENIKNSSELSISPDPFSPDNDGFEDVTFINFKFNFPLSSLSFKIFDSKGRLVKSIYDTDAASSEGSLLYNGYGDDNVPLRLGIYILLAEGRNYLTGEIKTLKTPFVVARRFD